MTLALALLLFGHGEHFDVFPAPEGGPSLRLLLGGPPFRLCEILDLASDDRARCVDVRLPADADTPELVAGAAGSHTLLRTRSTLTDPATGTAGARTHRATEASDADLVDATVTAEGPFAGLRVDARGYELLRFHDAQSPDHVRLPGAGVGTFLLGDRAIFRARGRLRARRVLSGALPFAAVEDLDRTPAWSFHEACAAPDGRARAFVFDALSRLVPNVGQVPEAGPATAVFVDGARVRTRRLELPRRPDAVSCAGDAITAVWTEGASGTRDRRRGPTVRRVRCTPRACVDEFARGPEPAATAQVAVDLGGPILHARLVDGSVRVRLAPLEGLASAPDRPVPTSGSPRSVAAFARAGAAALLVDYPDHVDLFRIAPDGTAHAITATGATNSLPDGPPRH